MTFLFSKHKLLVAISLCAMSLLACRGEFSALTDGLQEAGDGTTLGDSEVVSDNPAQHEGTPERPGMPNPLPLTDDEHDLPERPEHNAPTEALDDTKYDDEGEEPEPSEEEECFLMIDGVETKIPCEESAQHMQRPVLSK